MFSQASSSDHFHFFKPMKIKAVTELDILRCRYATEINCSFYILHHRHTVRCFHEPKSLLLFLLNFIKFLSAKKNNPRFLVALLQLEIKILPILLHQKLPSKTSLTCPPTSLQREPENAILQQKFITRI